MALTKEQKKERRFGMYPPAPVKSKCEIYAKKKGMSMAKVFIEGAKLYMKLNPVNA